jgi:hypothetical protein
MFIHIIFLNKEVRTTGGARMMQRGGAGTGCSCPIGPEVIEIEEEFFS